MRNRLFLFGCLGLAFSLFSCDDTRVYDAYKSVPNEWNKDSVVSFNFKAPDTLNSYNLFINLRNNSDYKYNNLFLIASIRYPHGKVEKDTLEYKMAKPNGEFLGEGFSDVKENKLWYKGYDKPFVFSENGDYQIEIQQAMRESGKVQGVNNLEGITDVGFRIENTQTK
ncbi:MAG: gliding motility lipoprotein GldH [Flavobacteriaceae bacterium]|nr:gliding motility lipoprotein GldH [Mangrovimonas sp.]MCB0434027.1 gliding motility lipoprotein GldH [Mangrovimonas sp.]MCB0437861.1 gliding motility lipoprotein GldH [Mangrovimonas sp.]MCB0470555.1 gliding motility lipoprotein GldH [Flavobacteriaceae bacterium]HPF96641.1 gliding motility lipoprotein GldH [Mangrovimonas sp.]